MIAGRKKISPGLLCCHVADEGVDELCEVVAFHWDGTVIVHRLVDGHLFRFPPDQVLIIGGDD